MRLYQPIAAILVVFAASIIGCLVFPGPFSIRTLILEMIWYVAGGTVMKLLTSHPHSRGWKE